jgi:tRNA-modifying protein YgfZ
MPTPPPATPSSPVPASAPRDRSAEYRAASAGAVVCALDDVAILAIGGADAAAFLHGQLSSDVKGLAPGACQYTSYNSPKGRMLSNLLLCRAEDEADAGFLALLPADVAGGVRRRLAMYVLRSRVTLADVTADLACYGVGGPAAGEAMRAALEAAPEPFAVARSGDATVLGLPGPRFVVLAPRSAKDAVHALLERHARPAAPEVWQWLTIRAGVPIITAATQEQFVAQATNWDVLGGVNFRKGCYTGQEIIARTQYLGRLKERLFAFHADAPAVAAGTRLFSPLFEAQPCGTVVNAAPGPGDGCDLLAVVQVAAAESGDVRLGTPDGPPLAPVPLPYAVPAAAPAERPA